ncbi:MAG: DUF2089 family protein [Phycisphaerales bacterium]|nr:DUF2089 family protein [Planctomycetota bacterium]
MAFHFPKGVPSYPVGVRVEAPADPARAAGAIQHPLGQLPREDQDLIVQLVLHSGSLKDLAAAYGVSYPTIRIRVDRVIERLRVIVAGRKDEGVRGLLARLVEQGEVSEQAARAIEEAVDMETGAQERAR